MDPKEEKEVSKVKKHVPVLSSVATPVEELTKVTDATVSETLEKVEELTKVVEESIPEVVEKAEETVEKLSDKLTDALDVTVREVELVAPKTFRWCLPFLPKFWGSQKEE